MPTLSRSHPSSLPRFILPSLILMASVLNVNTAVAAQTSNAFTVSVRTGNTSNPPSDSAFCRSNTAKAMVTVVCETADTKPIPYKPTLNKPTLKQARSKQTNTSDLTQPLIKPSDYRFITRFAVAADYRDTIAHGGVGTVSSWRTVNLHDRDYLELLIGW